MPTLPNDTSTLAIVAADTSTLAIVAADTVATAKPKAKRARKPAKPAATPVPVLPAVAAVKPGRKPDITKLAATAERVALIGANRIAVAAIYDGPSLSVRGSERLLAASAYAELHAMPKHRTTIAKLTVRDASAAALLIRNLDKTGSFNPAALNCDRGNFSRLCSVNYIVATATGFGFTPDGASFARRAAGLPPVKPAKAA